MIQQVTVTTHSSASLKSLLTSAVQNEQKVLQFGIRRTQEKLAGFEMQHGIASTDFEQRYHAAQLDESLDFMEWLGEIRTLRLLENQLQALKDANIE